MAAVGGPGVAALTAVGAVGLRAAAAPAAPAAREQDRLAVLVDDDRRAPAAAAGRAIERLVVDVASAPTGEARGAGPAALTGDLVVGRSAAAPDVDRQRVAGGTGTSRSSFAPRPPGTG